MPCSGKNKSSSYGALILFILFCLVSACSGDDSASGDGDTDAIDSQPDGDSSIDGDTESIDPCAELQCEPGGECLIQYGDPYCKCEDGYHPDNAYRKCISDNPDGDAEEEIDIDWDYDMTACDPASTPWPELPCCNTDGSGPRPCIIDLDFEYTNDIGEFTLGLVDSDKLDSFDIHEDKIIFSQGKVPTPYKNGVKIFDYKSKSGVLLDNIMDSLIDECCIGAEKAWFSKRDHYIVDTERSLIYAKYFYSVDLNDMKKTLAEDTESEKDGLECENRETYWLDNRLNPEVKNFHIYHFTSDNEEAERLDSLSEGPVTELDVYGDSMLYSIAYGSIVLKDLVSGTETLLTDKIQEVFGPQISEKYATWYDHSHADSISCGRSLVLYDREKEKAEYFKTSSGLDDHIALELWGDWMLYYECHGGFIGSGFCCDTEADGDIYIYHFPTQKSWKLTDSPGARYQAEMDDHLIIWRDGRTNPDDRTSAHDFYGIDLCLHPELKDYFESCKDGGGAEKK